MNYPLDILMLPIQLIVAWFTVYYTVIAVFGIWHRKDRDLSSVCNNRMHGCDDVASGLEFQVYSQGVYTGVG